MHLIPLVKRSELWRQPNGLAKNYFDNMVDRLFSGEGVDWSGSYRTHMYEGKDNLYLEVDLPGFKRDGIEMTLEKDVLSIAAKREHGAYPDDVPAPEDDQAWQYARQFRIPVPVDESRINAKLDNGVLFVTMPKREEVKPKSIPIE